MVVLHTRGEGPWLMPGMGRSWMRTLISVKTVESGWTVDIEGLETRRLRRSTQGFPLPPEQEAQEAYVQHLHASPEQIREVYSRILRRLPLKGEMDAFGRYLFDTLLGEAAWEQLKARARETDIDFVLRWDADAWALAGLPWEMMKEPEGFLARRRRPRVSLVRLAPTVVQESEVPSIPLRVLFVIGIKGERPHNQPGAEYLAVLNELRDAAVPLNSRVLVDATPEKLEKAVEQFQPTIVHFICHGEWNGIYLREDHSTQVGGQAKGELCTAQMLGDLFQKKSHHLPTIVVLNACDSSGMPLSFRASEMGGERSPGLPLSVQLSQLGIPMVIGMAGRIADHACRLFSRHFYSAFLEGLGRPSSSGEEVLLDAARAVAEGRRAALIHFDGYSDRSDWSFSNLVVRDGMRPVVKVEISDAAKLSQIQRKADGLKSHHPFCDRLGARQKFEHWLDSGAWERKIFAIRGPPELSTHNGDQYGLSCLLGEFATLALYSDFIPCDLDILKQQNEPPSTLWRLAEILVQRIKGVRSEFELGSGKALQFDLLQAHAHGEMLQADLHEKVEGQLLTARRVDDPQVVRAALSQDLKQLSRDAVAAGWKKGVMVFLDAIHLFGANVSGLPILLTSYGLGLERCPIPVVFTASCARGGVSPLEKLINRMYMEIHDLGPFSKDQGFVPYEQFLLSYKKLVFKSDADESAINRILRSMHKVVQGIPSRLYSREPDIQLVVDEARDENLIEEVGVDLKALEAELKYVDPRALVSGREERP
ncbi:CHAT domain-containing protein [Archangium gephyra]|nr:CHAT domain-containing protein [Archangium gephyra]